MSLMRRPLLLLGGIVAVVVLAGATVWVTHDTTSTMRPEEARTAATRTFREWSTALKRGAVEQPKRVFANPPFPVLRQRLRDAARAYGFRIERISIRWPRQQAPFVVVRTSDPTRFARDLPAFLRNLNPNGDDRTGWAYEGFYLQALDATGQPFLIVFNNWRGNHPGGGQWASDPKLLPFAHG
jgi:hypothetical protein